MQQEYLISYWYITAQAREQRVGYFTEQSWEWFASNPHPTKLNVVVIEEYRVPKRHVN